MEDERTSTLNLIRITGWLTICLAIYKILFDSFVLIEGLVFVYKKIPHPPQPGFAITVIVYAVSALYIIFGKRMVHAPDRHTRLYMRLLFVSSIALAAYEILRLNAFGFLLAGLAVLLLFCDFFFSKQLKIQGFKESLISVEYIFGLKSLFAFVIIVSALVLVVPNLETRIYPQVMWKSYQNDEWGFRISYPEGYSFVDSDQNMKGTIHYLSSSHPFLWTTNSLELLEIGDLASMGADAKPIFSRLVQVFVSPMTLENPSDLDSQIRAMFASTTQRYGESLGHFSFNEVKIGKQNYPSITFATSTNNSVPLTDTYVYIPLAATSSQGWPALVFTLQYAPNDDMIVKRIVSSFQEIPIVLTDKELYLISEEKKDQSLCDEIKDELLRTDCHINIRGYPIVNYFPILLNGEAGRSGTVQLIGTSTIKLSTSKRDSNATSSNSWIAFAVQTGEEPWRGIQYDAVFSNGVKAGGLLNAYWDKQDLGSEDGRLDMSFVGFGPWEFASSTDPYSIHVIGFRLDSFASAGTTSVTVSNIRGINIH